MAAKKPTSAPTRSEGSAPRRRRIVESMLVFAGCLFLIDALVGEKGLVAMLKARDENRQLERTLEAEEAETAALREEARWLRDDLAAIEDLARRELGLIKPGEKVFTIKDVAPAVAER